MKRRLNILCILVFLVLGYSLYATGYQLGAGIKAGLNLGKQQVEKIKEHREPVFAGDYRLIDIVPTTALWQPDSVYNVKTGEEVPVMYTGMAVQVDKTHNLLFLVVSGTCSLLNMLFTLGALVFFVRLMLSINKSDIFEWKNVRRLRWLGGFLIAVFICTSLPKLMSYWGIKEVFGMEHYMVAPLALLLTDLLLGLGCLIVGETFAIGLKMKEEQDLTI